MKSTDELKRLILRQIHYGQPEEGLAVYPPDEALTHMRFLGEKGYISGEIIRDGSGKCLTVVGVDLTAEGYEFLQELEQAKEREKQTGPLHNMTTANLAVFVSHSSKDELLAQALVELIRASLNIPQKEIRCTSVNGYRLEAGASTEEQLRIEVNSAKVLIGVITPASMDSAYVLFELGARWGQKLPLIPMLGNGATASYLRGPLAGLNALSCDDSAQIHQMIEDLARKLGVKDLSSAASYHGHIEHVAQISKHKQGIAAPSGNKLELGASSQTKDAVPPHDADEMKIMRLYCGNRDTKLMVEQVAIKMGMHPLKVDQLLDSLVKRKLLYEGHRMGSPSTFRLATAGRDFLIAQGLVE
jgi:hypothetical protein